MVKNKRRLSRYSRELRKDRLNFWDEEGLRSSGLSRKAKKHFAGTLRQKKRAALQEMRTREHCQHDRMDLAYTYIPGEFIQEPSHGYCADCGITEMELAAKSGSVYWRREYPQYKAKYRKRAIERLENQYWESRWREWKKVSQ